MELLLKCLHGNQKKITFFLFWDSNQDNMTLDDLCTSVYFQKVSFNVVPSLLNPLITWAQSDAYSESSFFSLPFVK